MSFSFTKDGESIAGDLRWTSGTFTNSGVTTGGDIRTGLQQIQGMMLQQKSDAVVAEQPTIDETFPRSDPVTIVTTAGADGYWLAFGY